MIVFVGLYPTAVAPYLGFGTLREALLSIAYQLSDLVLMVFNTVSFYISVYI